MTSTTKGPTFAAEPFSTRCANTSQQFQPSSKEQNVDNSSNRPFRPTDRVRLAEHLVPHFYGQTHGTVDQLPVGTKYQDVQVDIGLGVYWFAATDLTLDPLPDLPQRVRGATLTPSYVDAGTSVGDTTTVDTWTCPADGCDFVIGAVGPVDDDEPDPFVEEVDEHRRSHYPAVDVFRCRVCGFTTAADAEQDAHVRAHVADEVAARGATVRAEAWDNVSTLDLWAAVREIPSVFDVLSRVTSVPPLDVARVLRAVADVLDGDSK